jgi:hypothetical protein
MTGRGLSPGSEAASYDVLAEAPHRANAHVPLLGSKGCTPERLVERNEERIGSAASHGRDAHQRATRATCRPVEGPAAGFRKPADVRRWVPKEAAGSDDTSSR